MNSFPNIVTVNKRKVKKTLINMGQSRELARNLADSYSGVFVVCGLDDSRQYTVIQHSPDTEYHQRQRNIPHVFTKRIKNNKHLVLSH